MLIRFNATAKISPKTDVSMLEASAEKKLGTIFKEEFWSEAGAVWSKADTILSETGPLKSLIRARTWI